MSENQEEQFEEENIQENNEENPSEESFEPIPEQSFKEELIEFFEKYRPSKLKHVDEIVKKFSNNQEEVIKHLRRRYARKDFPIETKHSVVEDLEENLEHLPNYVFMPNKNKSGFILGVILSMAIIGVLAFVQKDIFTGETNENAIEVENEAVNYDMEMTPNGESENSLEENAEATEDGIEKSVDSSFEDSMQAEPDSTIVDEEQSNESETEEADSSEG